MCHSFGKSYKAQKRGDEQRMNCDTDCISCYHKKKIKSFMTFFFFHCVSHDFFCPSAWFYLAEGRGGKPSPLPYLADVLRFADSGSVYLWSLFPLSLGTGHCQPVWKSGPWSDPGPAASETAPWKDKIYDPLARLYKNVCSQRKRTHHSATPPVSHETLVLAEVAEEASVIQVHDGVLLPSDVHVHRQPVIC